MHALIVVGLGSYGSGVAHGSGLNCCSMFCCAAGVAFLAVALWYLMKAPEMMEVALPPSESPRR
ncbi:MAG TPA: hypothetical protein DEB40_07485 [Elusimicrobia bacterium]|nr:hypothetical protein [Elusimicrobiota bacterium]HBT61570.1 hypothetical protein [Elusimicrobiota bacterium]